MGYIKAREAALESFREAMEEYGLTASSVVAESHYECGDILVVRMETAPQPVAGNKKIISSLRVAGYQVIIKSVKYMLLGQKKAIRCFAASKTVRLLPDDAGKTRRQTMELMTGAYYTTPEGVRFRCMCCDGIGDAVIRNEKTGIKFRVGGVRLDRGKLTWERCCRTR